MAAPCLWNSFLQEAQSDPMLTAITQAYKTLFVQLRAFLDLYCVSLSTALVLILI